MYLICGEALFDFFLEQESGPGSAAYAARAGGSPFNVAIGIARLGGQAALLTGLSQDLLGQRLRAVLAAEGVETAHAVATHRPTTLSLVGLDAAGQPAYQFYGTGAADVGLTEADLPDLGVDITGLHFGSYSIAVPPVADSFATLAARSGGRLVSLDPNIRPSIEPDMAVWRRRVEGLSAQADVVKISLEDLTLLYPGQSPDGFAADVLARGVTLCVATDGGGQVKGWLANGAVASAEPPAVTLVDTVGAGDTFQAALLAQLAAEGAPKDRLATLGEADLAGILDYAARAAAITCSRRGADLPRAAELA